MAGLLVVFDELQRGIVRISWSCSSTTGHEFQSYEDFVFVAAVCDRETTRRRVELSSGVIQHNARAIW